eukprot:CAMPEP_0170314466 /NCGR_PEP_ID=MMETSP0116_2-20130129/57811_1 /TAXON_ID=400756 /ORGANISM="Durinskia baltica, Strain CSIRO CS-38" /LENGTH=257 /DNA_ID=CAMNT_0010566925 /DNA_START=1 /DNA_END=774 /DNA_ORIENTATION=-
MGESFATLLACVLLEQRIILLGNVPQSSLMALLLRACIWPFRWLHLFMAAPPPLDIRKAVPLLDSMTPMLLTLSEFPAEWGCRSLYQLPKDVICGTLKRSHVHRSPELETSGGLKGEEIKLPADRHKRLSGQFEIAKKRLKKGEYDIVAAVAFVQDAIEHEITLLAGVVKEYAQHRIALSQKSPTEEGVAESDASFCDRCIRQACEPAAIEEWLTSSGCTSTGTKHSLSFFLSFFQTQLFIDLLEQQVCATTQGGVA